MSFRFKQFSIDDHQCTMRVGTDSTILGAWMEPPPQGAILDIGAGCGILSLMLAQRGDARIVAIEPDQSSAIQCQENFTRSPWNNRLEVQCTSFQTFQHTALDKFDLLISNPPYFSNSLKSPSGKRNLARHTDSLSAGDLCQGAVLLFKNQQSRLGVILPTAEVPSWVNTALKYGLHVTSKLEIYPKPNHPANRTILTFTQTAIVPCSTSHLVIRNSDHSYSTDYIALTKEFYLKF